MKSVKLVVLLFACMPVFVHADDLRVESNTLQGSTNLRTITLDGDALFKSNQAVLSAKGEAALNELLTSNTLFPLDSYRVVGHADHLGKTADNQRLSLQRAKAVANYLHTRNKGLKLEAVGMGEREPKATCAETLARKALIACLAPNRRVEIERLHTQ